MNKRRRFSPLGASEFAAILNGEDPGAIHDALRRFVQTVREERRAAVGDSSLEVEKTSESSTSEDEEDKPLQKKQKFRKEDSWKEDTAKYDVPFVGTSVARGDTSRVVAGEWPTGLLKAYVEKSPRAIEFNHLLPGGPIHKILLRRKHGRTWHKIQKLYLQAVSELITMAVPLECIKNDTMPGQYTSNKDSSTRQIVETLVSSHFAGWCLLLKEETGNGKGKAGVVGGCGELAQYIIRIFHRLTRISSEKARHIMRDVEQSISEHVLRFLLKKPIKEGEEYAASSRAASKIELLEWVGWLTSIPDHSILSRLCSPGARERKISPGLLYMSLRDGSADFGHDSVASAIGLVVRKLRDVLLSEDSRSRKILIDLFSRDVVQSLCQVSVHAPVLSSQNSVEKVLQFIDKTDNQVEAVGSEARRLLLILICNPEKSPFVQSIRKNLKSTKRTRPVILQIVQHFLKSESGEITKLVLQTVRVNPSLFGPLLQNISFPDMKRAFAFIARVNFAANFILHGPSIEECLKSDGSYQSIEDDAALLHLFLPCNMKDTILRKALQSGNTLIVAEVLKLIVFVFKRICYYPAASQDDDEKVLLEPPRLWNLLKAWIPEPSLLVSILVKFDASQGLTSLAVTNRVCLVLNFLLDHIPEVFYGFTFDWSKLLSKDSNFNSARSTIQGALLRTIMLMLQANQLRLPPGTEAKFCYDLLHILLHTKFVHVYDLAKKTVLYYLSAHLGNHGHSEQRSFVADEISCWIDGLSIATLSDFFSVLQQILQQPYHFTLQFAKIWLDCVGDKAVPRMPFTALMIQSLRLVHQLSSQYTLLYSQVATNALLFHNDPVALATVIKEVHRQEKLGGASVCIDRLVQLIDELFFNERSGESKQLITLGEHLESLFSSSRHPLLCLIQKVKIRTSLSISNPSLGWEDVSLLVRQCSNQMMWHETDRKALSNGLKSALPGLLLKLPSAWKPCSTVLTEIAHLGLIMISGVSIMDDRGIQVDAEVTRSLSGNMLELCQTNIENTQDLYQLLFTCPCLSSLLLGELLCQLIDEPKKDPIYSALTANILDLVANGFVKNDKDYLLCGKVSVMVVKLWCSLGSELNIPENKALVKSADNAVKQMLSGSNLAASFALCALLKREPTEVVAECIGGGVVDHPERIEILLTLLDREPASYAPAIVEALRCLKSIPSSKFDDLLVALKISYLHNDDEKEFLLTWQHDFLKRLLKDIADNNEIDIAYHFQRFERILEEVRDSSMLIDALSIFINKCRLSPKEFKLCFTKLTDATERISMLVTGERPREVASLFLLLLTEKVNQSVRSCLRNLGTNKDNIESKAINVIDGTITLLNSTVDFDLDCLRSDGKESINNAVKVCLRVGLRPVNTEADVLSWRCLKLARSYVSSIQSGKLCGMFNIRGDFSSLVFEMASTHSNFHDLLRNGMSDLAKRELLDLLLECLENARHLAYDKEVWQTLLCTFGCGMSSIDLTLRKIVARYGWLEKEVDTSLVTMDQFTWGMPPSTSMPSADSFLNALEMYRIQATLCNFPIHDSTDPFLVELSKDGELQRNFIKDDRYSPGFLLPLALAQLEFSMDIDHEATLVSTGNVNLKAVELAQRYCERGVAALCFMALASNCKRLRHTGLAILGLLNFLAGSKLALESSTWRSRPQLMMLLDSFRRSMVIFNETKESTVQCPQLPGLSALFLARASLVLSHPGDEIYANINRVFLRIEKDHGAFQDLWRLPSFVALFCSAADDHEKLLEERIFALRLVRDGFLNEMCYKPLHACHGIEMILSSFGNYCMRSYPDKRDEFVVLMEALERLVNFGGIRSSDHLFKRLGLLSFWRSLILARPLTSYFQTSKERGVFLSCFRACMNHASSVLSKDDFSLATQGLWPPLLDFFLELIASDKNYAFSCLSTLSALKGASHDRKYLDRPIGNFNGVAFSMATRLLRVMEALRESSFAMILCTMPLCTSEQDADAEHAATICLGLLRMVVRRELALYCALVRIESLINHFASLTFDRNEELLVSLLKLRSNITLEEEMLSLWQKCVFILVNSRPNDIDEHCATVFRKLSLDLIQ
ncbi:hypothetical protein FisN_8Lh261 [Fistulifera solaris]|uniref:URB1 C-terminal domain-containing protein n=1 Tax=Fistulifera solaris TaxID=1519565 RepID=A0A1Z5JNV2_FISSO|nr:hypothetical protein FisN_8Lh261 [Fistulifera solaris]|eukprot:GAX15438.1 hypothetical protein FisN_8Lh261 [Fistulifera solaris]